MTNLSAVIADDERLAQVNLRAAFRPHQRWSIVEAVDHGHAVCEAVERHRPHLLVLDVRMPGLSGIEVARALAKTAFCPLIVFATAFDRYAVEAFELCAFDYLLKPFDNHRFDRVIGRVEQMLDTGQRADVVEVLNHLADPKARLSRLLIRSMKSIRIVPIEDVVWFEASGNYVDVHHRGGRDLHRIPLSALEGKLDPSVFCRVHRSSIIRVSEIRELRFTSGETQVAILSNGAEVRVSGRYRDRLLEALGND
ncbi:MAG: LytTR family DNA-binding domain-containing protein [Myxococcota bacterium]